MQRKLVWPSLVGLAVILMVVSLRLFHQDEAPLLTAAPEPLSMPSKVPLQAPEVSSLGLEQREGARPQDVAAERKLRGLFTEGQFVKAMQLVREQEADPSLSPAYKDWLKRQAPILKLGWAWHMIRDNNCIDAVPILEDVLVAGPQPLALKGIGYCYLQKKDWWSATSYLDRYLEQKASDPEGYILLAEAKESLGSYDEALQLTQKAKDLTTLTSDESKDLDKREKTLAVRAEEGVNQVEMQAGFFLLRYQSPEHQYLIPNSLEQLQNTVQSLVQTLGFNYPEAIEVVFHKAENFKGATHGPSWAAALYDGRIRIPILKDQPFNEAFEVILRHEVTHAMLSEQSLRRKLPTWFQEGLAQVAECPSLCWHHRFESGPVQFLPLEDFSGNFMNLTSSEAKLAYDQSLYLMRFLNQSSQQGIRPIIEQIPYLKDLSSESLVQQVGLNFAQLHAEASAAWQAKRDL